MRIICCLCVSLLWASCSHDEAAQASTRGTTAKTHKASKTPTGEAFRGLSEHVDLSARLHLAEINDGGWLIDLGTPAQTKFTVGDWRSGWVRRGTDGDRTYADVGIRGRLYVSVDKAEPLVARVTLKSYGTQALTPYLNGKELKSLALKNDGAFHSYDFALPADKVRRGENYLLLTFGATAKVGGKDVAAAVDSVRIASSAETLNATTPAAGGYQALLSTMRVGGHDLQAWAMAPGSAVRSYLQVPAGAKLGFTVGAESDTKVTVVATDDAQKSHTLFDKTVGQAWTEHVVDLGSLAGQIIQLDFKSAGGQGRVGWHAPKLYVEKAPKPEMAAIQNVVVLLIDTLRADKLKPFNKKTRVKTPVIDALAKQGIVFEVAQSPENWTKPAVASVLTGLHPMTHQQKTGESKLPNSALLLSEHLKGKGFATGSFIANGYVSDKFGFKQGWDHYTNYIRETRSVEAKNVFKEAGDWIEANKDKRFFTYIQTIDPHVPYDPPDAYTKMYDPDPYTGPVRPRMTGILLEKAKRRPPAVTFTERDKKQIEALHDGEITQHDEHLGAFVERLKTLGLWDKTLLVITSDHGEEFEDHGSWGHGHSIYQELLRVPLMVRLPGDAQAGRRVADTVTTMDIPSTVTELLGVDRMPDDEGKSLVGALHGRPLRQPMIAFSDFQNDRRVATAAGYKFVLRGNLTSTLFNLRKDPREKNAKTAADYPVAQRYLRIMQSQFLGASDRGHWMVPTVGSKAKRPKKVLKKQDAQMDEQIKEQLRALGYAH